MKTIRRRGTRTFGDDYVELDDVQIVEGLHHVAVRVRVLLRGVCHGEGARREEGVAWCTKVLDSSGSGFSGRVCNLTSSIVSAGMCLTWQQDGRGN